MAAKSCVPSTAVDIEVEVFAGDLLIGAISQHPGNGFVYTALEVLIFLTKTYRSTAAQHFGIDNDRAGKLIPFTLIRFQKGLSRLHFILQ